MSVYEVAVAADDLLVAANLPHGFGGALAFNYYADPRATVDVDLCSPVTGRVVPAAE